MIKHLNIWGKSIHLHCEFRIVCGNNTEKARFMLNLSPFFGGAIAVMLWGKFSTQCVIRLNHTTLIDVNGNLWAKSAHAVLKMYPPCSNSLLAIIDAKIGYCGPLYHYIFIDFKNA